MTHPLARTAACSLALATASAGCAPTTPEDDWVIAESADLSARVDALFAKHDTPGSPGGIAALIHRGRIVHLDGYGSANREFRVPWTPDVRYRIASITKGVTGHATLLLADAGALALDDPVQRYLTDFPTFPAPLTIRHLITNTSGLWYDEWLLPMAGITGHATLDEMYALARRQDTLNYTPGTAHNYIDTNWRMMAR
ncbi:MAG: serine hydrolase, partial [Gemmatimonadetes bacterium]|nr:serine hydrolase [Gemmatimonadota bacterium]